MSGFINSITNKILSGEGLKNTEKDLKEIGMFDKYADAESLKRTDFDKKNRKEAIDKVITDIGQVLGGDMEGDDGYVYRNPNGTLVPLTKKIVNDIRRYPVLFTSIDDDKAADAAIDYSVLSHVYRPLFKGAIDTYKDENNEDKAIKKYLTDYDFFETIKRIEDFANIDHEISDSIKKDFDTQTRLRKNAIEGSGLNGYDSKKRSDYDKNKDVELASGFNLNQKEYIDMLKPKLKNIKFGNADLDDVYAELGFLFE